MLLNVLNYVKPCLILLSVVFLMFFPNVGNAATVDNAYDIIIDFEEYPTPKSAVRALQDALNVWNSWSDSNGDLKNDDLSIMVTGNLSLHAGHATKRKVMGVPYVDRDLEYWEHTRILMEAPYSTIWTIASVGSPPYVVGVNPVLYDDRGPSYVNYCPGIDIKTGYPVACYHKTQSTSPNFGQLNLHFNDVNITYSRGDGGARIPEAEGAVILLEVGDRYLRGSSIEGGNITISGHFRLDLIGSPACCDQNITGIGPNYSPGTINPFSASCPDQGNTGDVCRGRGTADVLNASGLMVTPGTGPRWDVGTGKGYRYHWAIGEPVPTDTAITADHLAVDAGWTAVGTTNGPKYGAPNGDGWIDDEQFIKPIQLDVDGFKWGVPHPSDLDGNGVLDDGVDKDVFVGIWYNGVPLLKITDFYYDAACASDPLRGGSGISGSCHFDHKTVGLMVHQVWSTFVPSLTVQNFGVGLLIGGTANMSFLGGAVRANRINFQIGHPYPVGCAAVTYQYNSAGARHYDTFPGSDVPGATNSDYPHHETTRVASGKCGSAYLKDFIYESGSPGIAIMDSRFVSMSWFNSYTEPSFPRTNLPYQQYFNNVAVGAGVNNISGQLCMSNKEASRQTVGAECLFYTAGIVGKFKRGHIKFSGGAIASDRRSNSIDNISDPTSTHYSTKGPFVLYAVSDGLVFGEDSQARVVVENNTFFGQVNDSHHCGSVAVCQAYARCALDGNTGDVCDLDNDGENDSPGQPYILFNSATSVLDGSGSGEPMAEIDFNSFTFDSISQERYTVYHSGGFRGQMYQANRSIRPDICPPVGQYNLFYDNNAVYGNSSRMGDTCFQTASDQFNKIQTPRLVDSAKYSLIANHVVGHRTLDSLENTFGADPTIYPSKGSSKETSDPGAFVPVSAPLSYPANEYTIPGTLDLGIQDQAGVDTVAGLFIGDSFTTVSCELPSSDGVCPPVGTHPNDLRAANGPRAFHRLDGWKLALTPIMGEDTITITTAGVKNTVPIEDFHPFAPGGAINFVHFNQAAHTTGTTTTDDTIDLGDVQINVSDASAFNPGDQISFDVPWVDSVSSNAGKWTRTKVKVVDVDLTTGQGVVTTDLPISDSYGGAGDARASMNKSRSMFISFQSPMPDNLTDKDVDDASITVGDTTLIYSSSGSYEFKEGALIGTKSAVVAASSMPTDVYLFDSMIMEGDNILEFDVNDLSSLQTSTPPGSEITFWNKAPIFDSGGTVNEASIPAASVDVIVSNATLFEPGERINFTSTPTSTACNCTGDAAACQSVAGCYLNGFYVSSTENWVGPSEIIVTTDARGHRPTPLIGLSDWLAWITDYLELVKRAFPIGSPVTLWRSTSADACGAGTAIPPPAGGWVGMPNAVVTNTHLGYVTGYNIINNPQGAVSITTTFASADYPGVFGVGASVGLEWQPLFFATQDIAVNCAFENNSTATEGIRNRTYFRSNVLPYEEYLKVDSVNTGTNEVIFKSGADVDIDTWSAVDWPGFVDTWQNVCIGAGCDPANPQESSTTVLPNPLNGAKLITTKNTTMGEYEVVGYETLSASRASVQITPALTGTLPTGSDQIIRIVNATTSEALGSYEIIRVDTGNRTLHLSPPLQEPLPSTTQDFYTSNKGTWPLIIHGAVREGSPYTGDIDSVFYGGASNETSGIKFGHRVNPFDITLQDWELEQYHHASDNNPGASTANMASGDAQLKLSALDAAAQPEIGDTLMVSVTYSPMYTVTKTDSTAPGILNISPGLYYPLPHYGSRIKSDALPRPGLAGNHPLQRCRPDLIIESVELQSDNKLLVLKLTTNVWDEVAAFTSASVSSTGTQPECEVTTPGVDGEPVQVYSNPQQKVVKYSGGQGVWGISDIDTTNAKITIAPEINDRHKFDPPISAFGGNSSDLHLILDGDQIVTIPLTTNLFICDPPGLSISCTDNQDWKKAGSNHGHDWTGVSTKAP